MALLTPNKNQEKMTFKVKIGEMTMKEIEDYCQWAGFKNLGEFVEQMVEYALDKDTEWKKARREG